jgi:streptogramin lyase
MIFRTRSMSWVIVAVSLIGNLSAAPGAEKIVLVAGGSEAAVDIPAVRAKLREPFGIDFDHSGVAYVVELSGQRVLKIENGVLKHVAGTGTAWTEAGQAGTAVETDHPGLQAQFHGMHNLAVSPDNQVFLADTWNQQVRLYDPKSGRVQTFAGTGAKGFAGDGGLAAKAQFGGIYC